MLIICAVFQTTTPNLFFLWRQAYYKISHLNQKGLCNKQETLRNDFYGFASSKCLLNFIPKILFAQIFTLTYVWAKTRPVNTGFKIALCSG